MFIGENKFLVSGIDSTVVEFAQKDYSAGNDPTSIDQNFL